MNIIFRNAVFVVALFLSINSFAQTDGLGTWDFFYGKVNLNKKWFLFLEPHLFAQKVKHDFNYYEYNAGVGYNLPKNIILSFAVGHYSTYQSDGDFKLPLLNNEFRVWEQIATTNFIGRLKIEQRYRLEQRYTSASGYRNRFRFRVNAVLPLNHKVLTAKTLYLASSDEIFITNEQPFFEQNWLFIGLGYQVSPHLAFHAGWLNRLNQSINHDTYWKNYFQTACIFAIDVYKKHPIS